MIKRENLVLTQSDGSLVTLLWNNGRGGGIAYAGQQSWKASDGRAPDSFPGSAHQDETPDRLPWPAIWL